MLTCANSNKTRPKHLELRFLLFARSAWGYLTCSIIQYNEDVGDDANGLSSLSEKKI